VIALKRGGSDTPANMQWQTVEEAKANGLPDILYRANGQKQPEIALSRRLARRC
jgi:hypothetical protein